MDNIPRIAAKESWKDTQTMEDDGSFRFSIDQVEKISTRRKPHKIGAFTVIEVSKIIDMVKQEKQPRDERLIFTHLEIVKDCSKKYRVVVQAKVIPGDEI